MNWHWKAALLIGFILLAAFVAAIATDTVAVAVVVLIVALVAAFVLGAAWIPTQRTRSATGDEASEGLSPSEQNQAAHDNPAAH